MNRNLRFAAAGAAAAATLFVHSRVRRAQRDHPARGRFAAGLHYMERGFGVPVVLLHGCGRRVRRRACCARRSTSSASRGR